MANEGQEIEGPNGFRLRFIRTGAETGGELLNEFSTEVTMPGVSP